MRRALLLLAALAAPVLAAAQSTVPADGQVVAGTTQGAGEKVRDDLFINLDECSYTGTGPSLELFWDVKLEAGKIANGGKYQLFASDTAPPTAEPRYCLDDRPTEGIHTQQVGSDITALANDTTESGNVPTNQFASKLGLSCTEGAADKTIYVCVHYFDRDNTRAGWAVGSLTIALRRPPAPSGVVVTGGENAIEVDWTAAPNPDPSLSEAAATGYRVVVTEKVGGAEVARRDVTAVGNLRFNGLQLGTVYVATVYSLSAAMNESLEGAAGEGEPIPITDYWEYYRLSGGVEEGGCGAGGAGPLGLLAVAALLAALRRRS